jgi:hypothetical protein
LDGTEAEPDDDAAPTADAGSGPGSAAGVSTASSPARCTVGVDPSQVTEIAADSEDDGVGGADRGNAGDGTPDTAGGVGTAPENIRCIGSVRTVVDVAGDPVIRAEGPVEVGGSGVESRVASPGSTLAKLTGRVEAALRCATGCGLGRRTGAGGHGSALTTDRWLAGPSDGIASGTGPSTGGTSCGLGSGSGTGPAWKVCTVSGGAGTVRTVAGAATPPAGETFGAGGQSRDAEGIVGWWRGAAESPGSPRWR